MKITKFGHCCLLIEYKGKRILTDPGAWSVGQNEARNIDLIFITHEHPDHLHIESLKIVLSHNRQARIMTNDSVGKLLAAEGIDVQVMAGGDKNEFGDILIEIFGNEHAEIYEDHGCVRNIGFCLDDAFFYPGDALTDPGKPIDTLALPVVAPWAAFKDCVRYALQVHPKTAIPVHDGYLIPDRTGPIYRMMPMLLEEQGIRFIPLRNGDACDTKA